MNRRTVIALIMLALLLFSLVVVAVTRPSVIENEELGEADSGFKGPTDRERTTPLDDRVPPLPEGEEGSLTEEPKPIVRVVNHSGWLNEGIYEVFGEVENSGKLTARRVSFHVIFKDGLFKTLEEVDGPADRTTLDPGEKSSFKIRLKDKEKSAKVGSYIVVTQIER